MPTDKRLSLTLNEKDIQDLNEIRENFLSYNKAAKFAYIDIVRKLIENFKSELDLKI